MAAFATVADVISLTGKQYTAEELTRVSSLLDVISDMLRTKATACGMDLDQSALDSASYANTLRGVTVDIVTRVMRQTYEGDAVSQESQSALGYTWQGTYAIPGGGIAGAIMRSDLKALGIRRQRIGTIEPYGTEVHG